MSKTMRHAFCKNSLKIREAGEENKKYIEGHFIVFGQKTELWTDVYEQIAPEAVDSSLDNKNDIRCLFNHNTDFVLGRTSSSTLELQKDATGLWGRVEINPDDTAAMDAYARVARGDISGCSFGFYPLAEDREEKDGIVTYTIKDAEIHEVSVCTFPAYEQTEIEARHRDFEQNSKKMFEEKKATLKKKLESLEG